MAQNDTHVALIILTTQMWGGGGGGILVEKTFSGQNFVFLRLRCQHPFLHKTKGPTRNPISPTPPPSFGGRPCQPPPPAGRAIFRSPRAARPSRVGEQGPGAQILNPFCMAPSGTRERWTVQCSQSIYRGPARRSLIRVLTVTSLRVCPRGACLRGTMPRSQRLSAAPPPPPPSALPGGYQC